MGMAKLNVFITAEDDPCKIDHRTWFVTIYHCDGTVLEWCNERYAVKEAPCGHLEIEVPPGCYYVKAVWNYSIDPAGIFWGNHFTDTGIVTACCGETACVTLFNPSAHRCGMIFMLALHDLARQRAIDPALVRDLEAPMQRLLGAIQEADERAGLTFELGHPEDFEELAEKAE